MSHFERLSAEIEQMLVFIIHDKSHVFQPGKPRAEMDEALRVCGAPLAGPFYLVLRDAQIDALFAGTAFDEYLSCTRNFKQVSRYLETGNASALVFRLETLPLAFDYQAYVPFQLSTLDATGYHQADGDFLIAQANIDQEVLLPFGTAFEIADLTEMRLTAVLPDAMRRSAVCFQQATEHLAKLTAQQTHPKIASELRVFEVLKQTALDPSMYSTIYQDVACRQAILSGLISSTEEILKFRQQLQSTRSVRAMMKL